MNDQKQCNEDEVSKSRDQASTMATSSDTLSGLQDETRLEQDHFLRPIPPEDMLCPITHELFIQPVKDTVSGHMYERSAILEWLVTSGTCPLTRQPMSTSQLVTDELMKEKADKWRELNNIPLSVEDESEGVLPDDDVCCFCQLSKPGVLVDSTFIVQQQQQKRHAAGLYIDVATSSSPRSDSLFDEYDRIVFESDVLRKWRHASKFLSLFDEDGDTIPRGVHGDEDEER